MQKIHKINKEKNFKKNWVDFDRGWIVIMHLFKKKKKFIRYRRYMNKGGAGRMTFDENEYDYEY